MPSESSESSESESTAESHDAATPTVIGEDPEVEARLEDALERVAHGAVVSIPASLVGRGLTLAFTAVLTNGFAASSYGLFALSRRFQRYLVNLALGFRRGLNRFLPNTESAAERDVVATFAVALLLTVGIIFGAALFLAAPTVARLADVGPRFELYLQLFAAGLPATVWLFGMAEILRGLEEVGPFNATIRLVFPAVQLVVGAAATWFLRDLALVAVGVVAAMGAVGVGAALWLGRQRGLRPRFRAPKAGELRRRYLRFTVPLFLEGFATQTQRLGYYPLIAMFLSGTAGGVFAVGVLVGLLVRLPLMGINQFISPVAAALHEEGHSRALRRLYHVTSRLALVGVTGLAVPLVVYRRSVMAVFGDTFVEYASLLPGFVVAMVAAAAAGSVGFLMTMTDHERALLAVNVVVTILLAAVAIPLTTTYGLAGLVATYLLMVALNNALEVVVLYRLEGLQPFTLAHAKPVVAAVPLATVALLVRPLAVPGAPILGSVLGLAAYGGVLALLGVDPVERRLVRTLADRYREMLVRAPFA